MYPVDENLHDIHNDLLKNRELSSYNTDMNSILIQDQEFWKKPSTHPIMFEECIRKVEKDKEFGHARFGSLKSGKSKEITSQVPSKTLLNSVVSDGVSPLEDNDFQDFEFEDYYRGCHLFVLLHGYQGSSIDMKLLKNTISMQHPEAIFLLSKKNENKTEGDIEEMGVRLAEEVEEFIEQYCPGSSLGRLR